MVAGPFGFGFEIAWLARQVLPKASVKDWLPITVICARAGRTPDANKQHAAATAKQSLIAQVLTRIIDAPNPSNRFSMEDRLSARKDMFC